MNNDLISRSELKEDLKQYFSDGTLESVSAKLAFHMIIRKIDDAPTVEQKYYERIVAQINPVIEARPQGEWKEFKYGLYYCSRCFERVDKDIERIETLVSKGERSNYCSVCGAKMGGTT